MLRLCLRGWTKRERNMSRLEKNENLQSLMSCLKNPLNNFVVWMCSTLQHHLWRLTHWSWFQSGCWLISEVHWASRDVESPIGFCWRTPPRLPSPFPLLQRLQTSERMSICPSRFPSVLHSLPVGRRNQSVPVRIITAHKTCNLGGFSWR